MINVRGAMPPVSSATSGQMVMGCIIKENGARLGEQTSELCFIASTLVSASKFLLEFLA